MTKEVKRFMRKFSKKSKNCGLTDEQLKLIFDNEKTIGFVKSDKYEQMVSKVILVHVFIDNGMNEEDFYKCLDKVFNSLIKESVGYSAGILAINEQYKYYLK